MQLYYFAVSPPCRAVMLTVEAIGLEMELIEVNTMAGENLTPEYEQVLVAPGARYTLRCAHSAELESKEIRPAVLMRRALSCLQLNPQKTIPFLVDDDLKLSESRAIMAYLVDQYAENDRLYPRNPEARALVNQRLYFDCNTLFASVAAYYFAVFRKLTDTYDPGQFEKMAEAFQILDGFLEGQDYVAGRNLTIADLSLVASVTTAEAFGFEVEEYKNVANWLDKIKASAPGYRKANGEPVEMFRKFIEEARGSEEEKEEDEKEEDEKEEEEGDE